MGQRMNGTFHPSWWCRSAHAQTIAGAILRGSFKLTFYRERFELSDGDFLDLDFLKAPSLSSREAVPLVVILHGLEGSSRAPYVQSLMREIHAHGWDSVAVNMRGCSGEPNRLKQTYHSGKTEDLGSVIRHLIKNEGRQKIYLVGYSIGGNILLKWLGEHEAEITPQIQTAAAISVPYDLTKSVELMDKGFNRNVYTRTLLRSLKSKVSLKEKQFPGVIRYKRIKKCTTFREFDREATASLNGFQNEDDYWSKTSCKNFLKSITIPTLLVHAVDDPFFPAKLMPMDSIHSTVSLNSLIVPHGGHLGFVAGRWPWKQEPWLERQVMAFFSKEKSDLVVQNSDRYCFSGDR